MQTQEFFHHVETGKLLPLYYLYGPERGLIDEALDRIKEKALQGATRDFNLEIFYAQAAAAEAILASLQVFPISSPRRVVVIHQADFIWNKEPSPYFGYFSNPNPLTCAVFIGERADLRTKFFQALGKKGAAVGFYPLSERELVRWIRERANQCGQGISEGAAALLLERIGTNLAELKLELQKLTLHPQGKKNLSEEDVLALTEDVRSESPFELPMAVGRLNLREVFRLLRKNEQQGDPPLLLFSLIVRGLRRIRRAQELKKGGGSKKEIENRLGIPPRRADEFWKEVEGFPFSPLQQLWLPTLEADQELKSSRCDKGLLLEKYLWTLLLLARGAVQKAKGETLAGKEGEGSS
jgi:DNA polymerase-3 subunit delta